MRHLVFALSLFALGCNMQGLPNGVGSGGTVNGDGGGTVGDGGGSKDAGGLLVDMAKGGEGATCKTACDCQGGLACFQNMCQASMLGMVYCCDDTANCPSGMFCQSAQGMFGRCGMGGGGGGGGGGGMSCGNIQCSNNNTCTQMGCARCRMSTGTCSAM
jgi:hypothetical protein